MEKVTLLGLQQEKESVLDALQRLGERHAIRVAIQGDAQVGAILQHRILQRARIGGADLFIDVEPVRLDADRNHLGAQFVERNRRHAIGGAVREVRVRPGRVELGDIAIVPLRSAQQMYKGGEDELWEILVGTKLKQELFGDAHALYEKITINGTKHVVVGILEHPLVAVRRSRQQQDDVAVGNDGVVDPEFALDGAGQDLAGRVVAQGLLDPQRNALGIGVHGRQLVGVLVSPERRVGKEFGGGLVARDGQQDEEVAELDLVERVAVDVGVDQLGDDVVGRALTTRIGHVVAVAEDLRGCHLRIDREIGVFGVHHRVRPVEELHPVFLRHAEQVGDGHER